jgi:hypothetical protein
MTTKTKNIEISFTEEQYSYLLKMARKTHKSVANVIKDAVGQAYDIEGSDSSVSKDATENAEKKLKKDRQLEAFRQIYGIWKDYPEIDEIIEELDKKWQDWGKSLGKYV